MKIAVCLPSLNEAATIGHIAQIVDQGLSEVCSKYPEVQVEILNFDSNSTDYTSAVFLGTKTLVPKQSFVISNGFGKGRNILEFCRYAIERDVDFCLTIDSDIISATPAWIPSLLNPLLAKEADYVTPIYRRSRFEGSSTNHFAFPLIYALTGYSIRQPIAGDFAFTNEIAEALLRSNLSSADFIHRYGIDIFMTITAICRGSRITQVSLGEKIHAPSFHKLEYMFPQIAAAALLSFGKTDHGYNVPTMVHTGGALFFGAQFKHKVRALAMKKKSLDSLRKSHDISWCPDDIVARYIHIAESFSTSEFAISAAWVDVLAFWIRHYRNDALGVDMAREAGKTLLPFFVLRAVSFWLWAETANVEDAEEAILQQARQLRSNLA